MKVEIVKFDNLGRGIGFINDKIIFVPKSMPGDVVLVSITKDKKKYCEGKITKIIKESSNRVKSLCPYFNNCGGCDLQHLSYDDTLNYKKNKLTELFNKSKLYNEEILIIPSKEYLFYRNKISLKVVNKEIGYYEEETHKIVNVEKCLIANKNINKIISFLYLFNINNGLITIRDNNGKLLIIIETKDKINIDEIIDKFNIEGIVVNDKCIYGNPYYVYEIDNYKFMVHDKSFFQVNPFITKELFRIIKDNTKYSNNLLDFYCGVGSLGIVSNANTILGVEVCKSAIDDANYNKKTNGKDNAKFVCSDSAKAVNYIKSSFDTIILDPPRSGVSRMVIDKIIEESINKIIYVSCNPSTLVRDLELLKDNYNIKSLVGLDMFPYTEHVESVMILEKK